MSDEIADIENTIALVADELFRAGSVEATLQGIVDLAQATVEGCDGAGIFLVQDGCPTTVSYTSPFVARYDDIQIDKGQGPCIDAAEGGQTIYASDLLGDERWPEFAPDAVRAGLRSVFALSLTTRHLGALNLYAFLPDAFGAHARAQGALFATLARHALDSAEVRAEAVDKVDNLGKALLSRELIGQAQGILMERDRITAPQAFDVLRKASQALQIKLTEVAARLIETGEEPGNKPR